MSGAVERRWGLRLGGALLLEDEGLHLLLDRLGRHLCLCSQGEPAKKGETAQCDSRQLIETARHAAKTEGDTDKAPHAARPLPSKAHAQPQLSNAGNAQK